MCGIFGIVGKYKRNYNLFEESCIKYLGKRGPDGISSLKINNLYYSGHFTVPGPGLPPAVISGKIAAKQIMKDN